MANFIGMVYATLEAEGIETKNMSTDVAVKKFNELQEQGGGKSGEKEGTPAENRRLEEKGFTHKKSTLDGDKIINKYQDGKKTYIIAKTDAGNYIVGYDYDENTGKSRDTYEFDSMAEAEQSFRENNKKARLVEQNLSKGKKPSLVDTSKLMGLFNKFEDRQVIK